MVSRGVNKVILVGNLGQNPEVRYMPNGGAVANITLATSDSWRDKQTGETKEKTEWHRVVLFGKLAEVAVEYLRKGSQVYIEGYLQTRKWQDHGGHDRYTTEIVVNIGSGTMQMLGSRHSSTSSVNTQHGNWESSQQLPESENNAQYNGGKVSVVRPISNSSSVHRNEPTIDFDDDIPF